MLRSFSARLLWRRLMSDTPTPKQLAALSQLRQPAIDSLTSYAATSDWRGQRLVRQLSRTVSAEVRGLLARMIPPVLYALPSPVGMQLEIDRFLRDRKIPDETKQLLLVRMLEQCDSAPHMMRCSACFTHISAGTFAEPFRLLLRRVLPCHVDDRAVGCSTAILLSGHLR